MEFLENFILFCCCFHFEFVKSSHSGPFINLALESKHITASSVAFGFSKSAVTDGKRVGYFERKSTVLMTKLEENPWIQVDFEPVNINQEGEISAIRVYMAESECSRTLTASKSKIGKCMSSKFSDMQRLRMFALNYYSMKQTLLSYLTHFQLLVQYILGFFQIAMKEWNPKKFCRSEFPHLAIKEVKRCN